MATFRGCAYELSCDGKDTFLTPKNPEMDVRKAADSHDVALEEGTGCWRRRRPPPPTMRCLHLSGSIAFSIILLHAVLFSPFSHAMAFASPSTTIVVSGACGKVGSRLLRELLNSNGGSNQIVALVRDANKLKNMVKDTGDVDNGIAGLSIMQADYSNPDQLRDAFMMQLMQLLTFLISRQRNQEHCSFLKVQDTKLHSIIQDCFPILKLQFLHNCQLEKTLTKEKQ